MIDFIVKYWLQAGFALLTAVVGGGFKMIAGKLKKDREEREALKDGVLALLHDRLYQGCTRYITTGSVSTAEMRNMEYLYKGYHSLGGNGTGTELFERVKDLPLRRDT